MHVRPTAAPRRRPSSGRRPRSRIATHVLGAALLIAALAFPTATAASPAAADSASMVPAGTGPSTRQVGPVAGNGRGVFEGQLERLVEETVASGRSIERFFLDTPSGSVELHFAGDPPLDFSNGARVRVHGVRDGNVVEVDPATAAEGSTATQVLAAAPGAGTGPRRIGVVPINFTNDRSRPFTRSQAAGIAFTNTRSARSYFGEESKGAVSIGGVAFDWISLPVANTGCDFRGWAGLARTILAERGVDVSSFTNFVFAFPQTNACAWRGLGHLPGWHTWINGAPTLRTVVHELGHNFGAHHASTVRCRAAGKVVALSSSCTVAEYGDPFTTMGGSDRRHDHAMHLAQLGYLAPGAARTVTASGTYRIERAASWTGTRLVRVARGDGTFLYLEYRRPYGTLYDNFSRKDPVVRGISIRIGADWGQITQTKLIDSRPWTGTFSDAALGVDRSFRDYLSGVTVTVVARSRYRAWVRVSLPADRTPPTTPGAFTATATSTSEVALHWSPATDNRALAGYRIFRDGSLVATTGTSATSFADATLQPETSYAYSIQAVDTSGNVGPAAAASATTFPVDDLPSAPIATIARQNGQWAIVSWTAAVDDNGVAGYRVLRDGVLVLEVPADILEAQVPIDGAVYVVAAVDSAGQLSVPSNEVRL